MFFSFSSIEILYVSSRVLLYVFWFDFSFCVNNSLEKKIISQILVEVCFVCNVT